MDPYFRMDVFFIVTTAVVVVVGAALTFALLQLARVLRTIERITCIIGEEVDSLHKDATAIRQTIRNGLFIRSIIRLLQKLKKASSHKKQP